MARHDFFLCPSDPQFSFEGNKEFEVFIRMSDSYLGPSTGGNLENNRLHTNVSAPLKLNTQYVRAVSFSYTYLQRVCIRVSAFTASTVVCLLYFEPFRVSVIELSVFHLRIYKGYA